jgi:hypothetical protein
MIAPEFPTADLIGTYRLDRFGDSEPVPQPI